MALCESLMIITFEQLRWIERFGLKALTQTDKGLYLAAAKGLQNPLNRMITLRQIGFFHWLRSSFVLYEMFVPGIRYDADRNEFSEVETPVGIPMC